MEADVKNVAPAVTEPVKEAPKTTPKAKAHKADKTDIAKVAMEVRNGQYGTGETLKAAIEDKGLNYKEVMAEVDKIKKY